MVLSTDTWLYLSGAGAGAWAAGGIAAPKTIIKTLYEPGTPELLPPLRYFGIAGAGVAAHSIGLARDKDATEKTKKDYLKIDAALWLAAGAATAIHGYQGKHKKDVAYGIGGATMGVGALMMFDACRSAKKSCCGGKK